MTHTRNELQVAYEDSEASKTELEGEYEALGNTYSDLSEEYSALEAEKEELSADYDKLKADYKALQVDYDAVQEEIDNYIDQQATISGLNSSMTAVNARYDELFQDYVEYRGRLMPKKPPNSRPKKRLCSSQAPPALHCLYNSHRRMLSQKHLFNNKKQQKRIFCFCVNRQGTRAQSL